MPGFFLARYEEVTLLLLRVVAGGMMMQHGVQKLFGWLGGAGPEGGSVPLVSQMGLAGVLETFGALLVLLGLFTRPAAFVMSGLMAAAYFMAHAPQSPFPVINQGELAALYCFVFLYFAARGGGRYSLDALLEARRGGGVAAQGAAPAGR